jgi:hypothetical protein
MKNHQGLDALHILPVFGSVWPGYLSQFAVTGLGSTVINALALLIKTRFLRGISIMNARYRMRWIWVVLFLLMSMVPGAISSAAQCAIPNGWQPYTVIGGENLYRIALRFGTTVTELQSGNCLNDTRIYSGQQLYVPNRSSATTPSPDNIISWRTTPATFQWYERGFMIWRADVSDIWVYARPVASVKYRNRLYVHPASEYGALNSDTPPAPAGYIQPILGFGKIWNNLNDYRETLGWAIQSEVAYTLRFGVLDGQMVEFTLPDGSTVFRQSDGFWSDESTASAGSQNVIIHIPQPGSMLTGGQSFTISGQAAGLFEASFVLELRALPSETLLDSAIVTYTAPEVGATGSWEARLTPINYAGSAELRAIYIQPADGALIVLTKVAVVFQ